MSSSQDEEPPEAFSASSGRRSQTPSTTFGSVVKTRSALDLSSYNRQTSSSRSPRRKSINGLEDIDEVQPGSRIPSLQEHENSIPSGLHRIRPQPARRITSRGPGSRVHSRQGTMTINLARAQSIPEDSGPDSPGITPGEYVTRFSAESLHSFSFSQKTDEFAQSRQNMIKRSMDFMQNHMIGGFMAGGGYGLANAQARVNGDLEMQSIVELLGRAGVAETPQQYQRPTGLGLSIGPMTGPASTTENVFEKDFVQSPTIIEQSDGMDDEESQNDKAKQELSRVPTVILQEPPLRKDSIEKAHHYDPPVATKRASLKRTLTDVDSQSLKNKLVQALEQPYLSREANFMSTSAAASATLSPPLNGAFPTFATHSHAHGRAAPSTQAIFTTSANSPWTINAANDLACLSFGISKAELHNIGILDVVREDKRKWLEKKLLAAREPIADSASPKPTSPAANNSSLGSGRTAKLLSKPPSRETARWRRTQSDQPLTVNRDTTPEPEPQEVEAKAVIKPRGVVICGDVISIKKRNEAFSSVALWVQEKQGALIWVMEEVAEDVAYVSIDEIGCITKCVGQTEAIWSMDRVRRGMDIGRLIPGIPRKVHTNTGALDFDKIAEMRRYTARTSNNINVPVTIDLLSGEATFRVSSFPHIAGMMVVSASTLRITGSNGPISEALFGRVPNGLPVTEIIPDFDKMLDVLIEEDNIHIVEGLVVPEQNLRRARANLAIREGKPDAAALFLRPSGLPAVHRDGSQIMIDIQLRVIKNDALGRSLDDSIAEEVATRPDFYPYKSKNLVYALWVTYSRVNHAINHGSGVFAPSVSRPPSPPEQPKPNATVVQRHVEESESEEEVHETPRPNTASSVKTLDSTSAASPITPVTPGGTPFKKMISDFNILEDMGAGAYGQVKLARQKSRDGSPNYGNTPADAEVKRITYSPVVIKYVTKARILVDTWTRDRRLGTVPLEIHVLDYLRRDNYRHPNIVEMSDFFEDSTNYYIEMIPHGLGGGMDLFDYIELKVNMSEDECKRIFVQVASAIEFLHTKCKVVHRDIKDENVILDGEGRVKVIDFGSANYIKNGPFDVFVGTIDYAAPEVLAGQPYRGPAQDIWALGILLYTILYKENPFYSIDEIMEHELRVPYVLSEESIDLARIMLDRDVEKRVGIKEVVMHEWVRDMMGELPF